MVAVFIVAMPFAVQAQTPGINQRGLAAASAPIIIGVVEEPWQTVIVPSKLPKIGPVRPQPNGTYSVELPKGPFNYLVGYIVRVRIHEVLKHDKWVRANQTIEIFVGNYWIVVTRKVEKLQGKGVGQAESNIVHIKVSR